MSFKSSVGYILYCTLIAINSHAVPQKKKHWYYPISSIIRDKPRNYFLESVHYYKGIYLGKLKKWGFKNAEARPTLRL